jgi:transketolase C-terminal domain/subunit
MSRRRRTGSVSRRLYRDDEAFPLRGSKVLRRPEEPAVVLAASVLAVEDNYVGGLGSELAGASAALAAPVRVESLGVRRIPKSGRTAGDVLDYVGLSVPNIVAAAERLARRDGASS